MDVKPLTDIAAKWKKRAASSAIDYKSGVTGTRKDQAELAISAAPLYEAGVTEAISRGAFQEGLRKSGTSKWKDKASVKGYRNYPTGVNEAEADFREGFAPMHSALSSLTLAPRGMKNSPENYERARTVGETLHKVKVGG